VRIALFTETFLPKIDGVVTRVVRSIEQLAAFGHEVLIFAPGRPPSELAGQRVVRVPSIPFRPWYPELFLGFPRPRIGRELDRFAPDVVHVVNPVILGLWGTVIARQRNLPLLASYHTDITQYAKHLNLPFMSPIADRFLRDVHNQAHVNLCTSMPMVNSARGLGIQRVRLWPKAVDTELYQPSKRSEPMRERMSGGHPDETLLLYVGRLSREKRVDWLYGPVTNLKNVRLALVGSGPAESELREQFKNTPTVFTGYLSGEELASAYASADVFTFPSDTETLGFVAMEAMASGVPVVGARAGGVPDVIRDGENGFMFTPGDLGDLTEKIRRLVVDDEMRARIGQQARKDMEPLGWRGASEALVDFYEEAIRVHRRFDDAVAV